MTAPGFFSNDDDNAACWGSPPAAPAAFQKSSSSSSSENPDRCAPPPAAPAWLRNDSVDNADSWAAQNNDMHTPCWDIGEKPRYPSGQETGREAGPQNIRHNMSYWEASQRTLHPPLHYDTVQGFRPHTIHADAAQEFGHHAIPHKDGSRARGQGLVFPKTGPASPSAQRVSAPRTLPLNPQQQGQPQREAGAASIHKNKNERKVKKQSAKHPATTKNTFVVQLAEMLATEDSQCVQPMVPSGTSRPQQSVAAGSATTWDSAALQASAIHERKRFGNDSPKEILPSRIPVLGLRTTAGADETNFGLTSKHEQQVSHRVPVQEGTRDPLNDLARLCASLAQTQATHLACQARTPSSAASLASPERSQIGWAPTPSSAASPARSPQRARSPNVGSCRRVSSPAYIDPVGIVLFNDLDESLLGAPPHSPDMCWARTPSTVFSPSVSPQRRESDLPGARVPSRMLPSVDVHKLNDIFCASTQPQPLVG